MHILWALIIGLIVGALAKLVMPGKDPGGIFITMLLGVAGSVIANLIGHEPERRVRRVDPRRCRIARHLSVRDRAQAAGAVTSAAVRRARATARVRARLP